MNLYEAVECNPLTWWPDLAIPAYYFSRSDLPTSLLNILYHISLETTSAIVMTYRAIWKS